MTDDARGEHRITIEGFSIVDDAERRTIANFTLWNGTVKELQTIVDRANRAAPVPQWDAESAGRADFARRCRAYLDDAPGSGGHSDAAGANAYELIEEAIEHVVSPPSEAG